MTKKQITSLLLALLFSGMSLATEVAGVTVADAAVVGGKTLQLNGAGTRSKFFIKVYVGALYLPAAASDATSAIDMPGPKRVLMHFVYDDVPAAKITRGWQEGFENNLDAQAFAALQPRLQQFNGLFEDMTEGDEVVFDYLPGQGTRVIIKGRERGLIGGDDFMRALLAVWLGEEPADSGLKAAMLGTD